MQLGCVGGLDFAPMASQLLGVSLRARRDTTQVMLGVSLRVRWDTTQVMLGVSLRVRWDTTLVGTMLSTYLINVDLSG